MNSEPQREHHWLLRLVGEWTYESECEMEPGKPIETFQGTEQVRALGDVWVLLEGCGEMPGGGTASMLMTLGYDPQKQRFAGTWIGSMMTHLWVYEGSLDAEGRTLTLHTEGPNWTQAGTWTKYRDVIEVKSDNLRVMTSHALDGAGNWRRIMNATYRRNRP